ncbi:MAG: DUF7144 family membrane protein [Burkholderiaceae bacterium]
MTRAQHSEPSPRPSGVWAGWITFAAVILTLIGTLNAIQGFIALFDEGYFLARGEDELLLVDYSAWGAIMLIWGLLLIAAAFSLMSEKAWARWFANTGQVSPYPEPRSI